MVLQVNTVITKNGYYKLGDINNNKKQNKMQIGTNDVEKYVRVMSKKNVRKVRNTKLVVCAMQTKVCGAEYAQENCS
jgi:hypothetical protein